MTGEFALAVHALVYLNHKAQTLSSEEVAENVCTNPARVRKVMAKLKKAGLVSTKEGVDGGYTFTKDPCQVNLRQINEALGTPLVSAAWHSGDGDMDCMIASGMAGVMDQVYDHLNGLCRQALSQITIAKIEETLFLKTPLSL